jgi:hypothetical protein
MRRARIGAAAAFVFLAGSLLLGAPAVSVPGLVGYWRLDSLAAIDDDSGNGNPGTASGGPTAPATVPPAGPPGIGFANPACFDFDGVDDFVDVGNPAALNLTNAISVCAWINPDGFTQERKVVCKWADTPGGDFSWLMTIFSASNDRPGFVIEQSAGGQVICDSGVTLTAGTWYHLVGTFDGANVRMYVDGALANTVAYAGTMRSGAAPVRIGAGSGATVAQEEPFDGRIDDVRIYNYALSAGEVTSLHNGQLPAPAPVLTATDGVGQVSLAWSASGGATSYNVRRGPAGGPYPVIANQAGLAYSDTSGALGSTYTYQVGAVNIVGEVLSNTDPGTFLIPLPRTDDHDEGFFEDKCSCGTASPSAPAAFAVLALLSAVLLLVRRGSG